MASNKVKTIRIIIEDRTMSTAVSPSPTAGSGSTASSSGSSGSSAGAPTGTGSGSASSVMTRFMTFKKYASKAETTTSFFADYFLDHIYTWNEDYAGETNTQNAKILIGNFKSIVTEGMSYAQKGLAFGGPIGAVIGAVIGATKRSAEIEIQRRRVLNDQTTQMNQEAYSLYFNTQRYGLIDDGKGTAN